MERIVQNRCAAVWMWALILAVTGWAHGDDSESPRLVVHLLDYLAKDYGGAVSDGIVTSSSEYAEQVEFVQNVVTQTKGTPALAQNPEFVSDVDALQQLIADKAEPGAVSTLARRLQSQAIALAQLDVAPVKWPNLANGAALYGANCALCHGESGRGDGAGGVGLEPKPADFVSGETMTSLAPFAAFNTIRMGVPGTGMLAFPTLSDAEVWDLAFYVIGLHHGNAPLVTHEIYDETVLRRVATSSDVQLAETMTGDGNAKAIAIAKLRLHSQETGSTNSLGIAREKLAAALSAYRNGNGDDAHTLAITAYLEGVEPIEPRLRANDGAAVVRVEDAMAAVRASIDGHKSIAEVEAAIQRADAELQNAGQLLRSNEVSPYVAFISAVVIILREGFEAMLLILALLSVVRAAGARRAARWVHSGWIAALLSGGVAWALSGYLLHLSGAGREMMEGVTALFAVAVLLYVGFWLHRQTEIGRWRAFLDGKVKNLVATRNLLGLAFISFVAAFRESLETVLFLRAIWIETSSIGRTSMAVGVFSALILTIGLGWGLLASSARIPVRKLFSISAGVMAILAIVLTGKGLHALQEAGHLAITPLPHFLRSDLLGVYPTWQTLGAQILCALLIVGILSLNGAKKTANAPKREKV